MNHVSFLFVVSCLPCLDECLVWDGMGWQLCNNKHWYSTAPSIGDWFPGSEHVW